MENSRKPKLVLSKSQILFAIYLQHIHVDICFYGKGKPVLKLLYISITLMYIFITVVLSDHSEESSCLEGFVPLYGHCRHASGQTANFSIPLEDVIECRTCLPVRTARTL